MKKNILLLLLTLFSLNLIYAQTSTIEPELQEVLNQKSDEMISINIIMKSQADVQKLQQTAAKANDRKSKREIIQRIELVVNYFFAYPSARRCDSKHCKRNRS